MNVPKIEVVDFGSNCRLGVGSPHLICFRYYVYLSLVLSACFHWWVSLLVWLLSSFFFIFLFVSVGAYVSFCDFVCLVLLLPLFLGRAESRTLDHQRPPGLT